MEYYEIKGVILVIFAVFLFGFAIVASVMASYHCLRSGSSAGYWNVFWGMTKGKGGVLFAIIGFPVMLLFYLLLSLLLLLRRLLKGESIWLDANAWNWPPTSNFRLEGYEIWLAVVPITLLFLALVVTVLLS